MINEQELNKKLTEWAGFTKNREWWLDPEGMEYEKDIPNFTQSLDACFKWLVPKLIRSGWTVALYVDCSGVSCELYGECYGGYYESGAGSYETNNKIISPLALCLTTEKLIDNEKAGDAK